ncbi:hypothetical protein Cylst_0405 [Cylindrospermum stagnale PCC 7417]|uniref:Uncharacterized protein n=1 Tax=Cylindrospermum stagnale PCC 7417 TaxID=56107 RepID=K9WQU1_9NOST|nr:hypothetical protein Cylst_0405 [Cylindrospermum stagnale PCC 7417]
MDSPLKGGNLGGGEGKGKAFITLKGSKIQSLSPTRREVWKEVILHPKRNPPPRCFVKVLTVGFRMLAWFE